LYGARILDSYHAIAPHAFADGEIVHLIPVVDLAAEGNVGIAAVLLAEVIRDIGVDGRGVELPLGLNQLRVKMVRGRTVKIEAL